MAMVLMILGNRQIIVMLDVAAERLLDRVNELRQYMDSLKRGRLKAKFMERDSGDNGKRP